MVDSISQLMCCGFALLNFTQSISQSYRYKCIIQQAQLYVPTWKMRISFAAKINQKAHAPHLCPEWVVQPCSVKCIYDPLTLCSLFCWGRITDAHQRQHEAHCWRTLRRWKPSSGAGTVGGSCHCCSLACLCWAKLYKVFLIPTQSTVCDATQNCRNP